MLANHKTATARRNTKQEVDRAKVAIGDPQIVLFDQGQDLAQQRTFLRVPIFTQDDLSGQHLLLVQYHQNVARQRRCPRLAQGFNAMFTGGEMIAIENLHAVSRHKRGRSACSASSTGAACRAASRTNSADTHNST